MSSRLLPVCDKDGERSFIQVSYLLASDETKDREYGAFDLIKSRGKRILLTMDHLDMSTDEIEHHYIPSWLIT